MKPPTVSVLLPPIVSAPALFAPPFPSPIFTVVADERLAPGASVHLPELTKLNPSTVPAPLSVPPAVVVEIDVIRHAGTTVPRFQFAAVLKLPLVPVQVRNGCRNDILVAGDEIGPSQEPQRGGYREGNIGQVVDTGAACRIVIVHDQRIAVDQRPHHCC